MLTLQIAGMTGNEQMKKQRRIVPNLRCEPQTCGYIDVVHGGQSSTEEMLYRLQAP